jgi:hypothetical protein
MKETDDDRIIKVKINKSPVKTLKKTGNLDQLMVDNPPMKNRNGIMMTEFVFFGDY